MKDVSDGEFDWVTAVANCTARSVFDMIKAGVRRDFERFKTLHPGKSNSYSISDERDCIVEVCLQQSHSIVFTVEDSCIEASRWDYGKAQEAAWTIRFSVALDQNGDCVMRGEDGKVIKPWQFRRRALEETMFSR